MKRLEEESETAEETKHWRGMETVCKKKMTEKISK